MNLTFLNQLNYVLIIICNLSCNILQWFKENYEYEESKNNVIKIGDIFKNFETSKYGTFSI